MLGLGCTIDFQVNSAPFTMHLVPGGHSKHFMLPLPLSHEFMIFNDIFRLGWSIAGKRSAREIHLLGSLYTCDTQLYQDARSNLCLGMQMQTYWHSSLYCRCAILMVMELYQCSGFLGRCFQ